jgi:hypothetical protein
MALGAALPVAASGGGAPVAILIPARQGCLGSLTMTVGVVYTNNPPGERRYDVEITSPGGARVFARSGRAPAEWRKWRYEPRNTGTYRTTYRLAWASEHFRTRVKAC